MGVPRDRGEGLGDAWFEAVDHPLKDVMLRVRSAILATDRRVGECVKWKCPTFTFQGNIASIDPKSKQHVNLLFHQGATLPGRNPSLEGGGGTVQYMRFEDQAAVRAKKADLQAAIRAWIQLKSA